MSINQFVADMLNISGKKAPKYDLGRTKGLWRALDMGSTKVYLRADTQLITSTSNVNSYSKLVFIPTHKSGKSSACSSEGIPKASIAF